MSTRIIAAPYAPLAPDTAIDPSLVPAYATFLKSDGVDGVFVNGTTGEGLSLSIEERNTVAGAWVAQKSEDFQVFIHVGSTATVEACHMAAHAESMGADAIGTIPPFYGKQTTDNLMSHMRAIADAAPHTPLYYYHIPCFTLVDHPMIELLPRLLAEVPTFAGIKFTHENLMDYAACQAMADSTGQFAMGFGRDELILARLAFGATLTVGSTYNYTAPLVRQIIKAFDAHDLARAQMLQQRLNHLIAYVKPAPMLAGKTFMKLRGVDTGPSRISYPTIIDEAELEHALLDALPLGALESLASLVAQS